MKKVLNIFAIIGMLIIASFIGWLVFKFAIGMVAFLIFACGGVCGFGIARLFPKKPKLSNQNQ